MITRKYRVAIIGGGWVSLSRYIPCFLANHRVEIVGVVDRTLATAEQVAHRFRFPFFADTLSALVNHGIDGVAICTPPWTHATLAIEAMKLGCHVLVEKPMAQSAPEAVEMIRTAEQYNVKLCVSHNFLFSRSIRKAEALIQQRKIGNMRFVGGLQLSSPARRLPTWYAGLPGGLFFDEAPHLLYLMEHFLGNLCPVSVRAHVASEKSNPLIEWLEVSFQAQSATGLMRMDFQSPLSEWWLGLFGTEKILLIDIFRDILITLDADNGHQPSNILWTAANLAGQMLAGSLSSGWLYMTRRLYWGHETLIKSFVDSVLDGSPVPVPPQHGLDVVKAMEEIIASARTLNAGAPSL